MHIKRLIKICPLCQKMNTLKYQYILIHLHWHHIVQWIGFIYIDTIGPFLVDKNGNEYIFNIFCSFSRFVELYAMKTTDAESAAMALISQFGRYGIPSRNTSDWGSQFMNDKLKDLATLSDITHILTVPYSKEQWNC